MKEVVIRRCPVCKPILARAQGVVAALRDIQGLNVEVVDGQMGEFSVLVDGIEVEAKSSDELPSVTEVASAVKDAGLAKPVA